MRNVQLFLYLMFFCINCLAQNGTKRSLKPTDFYLFKNISDAQVSPDGKWIAYTLSTADSIKDKRNSDIWMVSSDGEQTIQLTYTEEGDFLCFFT